MKNNPIPIFLILFFLIFILGKETLKISDSLFQYSLSAGLFTWLIKGLGSQFFKKELESYKHTLNRDLKRHELDLKLIGNKADYLHNKQAEVLGELYSKIFLVNKAINQMIPKARALNYNQSFEEYELNNRKIASQSYKDFIDYFHSNLIFISPDIVSLLEQLENVFKTVIIDYIQYNRINPDMEHWSNDKITNYYKSWNESITKSNKMTPDLLVKIEFEFRRVLGVRIK